MIDPKSTAGVLLREHDTLLQAAEYAERKARTLIAMHNACGLDYAEAARQLRDEMVERSKPANVRAKRGQTAAQEMEDGTK